MAGKKVEPDKEVEVVKEDGYVPLDLRNKLEDVACKMVDKLSNFSGEYNANQLKSLETALEIYRTISY